MEHRQVTTVEIPGEFIQVDTEGETVHMKLECKMVQRINHQTGPQAMQKYISMKKGKYVLYTELKKLLYGNLQAAMLFWRNLISSLYRWDFEINPYDWCVTNKKINNKQLTAVWNVNDLKISHVDDDVVIELIAHLIEQYGKETELTTHKGKVHK